MNSIDTHPFLPRLRKEAEEASVEIRLESANKISYPGGSMLVNGFFTHVPKPVYGMAVGKPKEEYEEILYHEYCHMRQWIERSPCYIESFVTDTIDICDLMDLWTEGHIELNEEQKADYTRRSIAVELDCEQRTEKLLVEVGATMNVAEYVQRANSYVLFYHMIAKYRQWYKTGNEPYFNEGVWRQMPENFDTLDYDRFPKEFEDLYIEHCLVDIKR